MIVKRDYLVTIRDPVTNDPIDYCRSNTFRGVVEYLYHSQNLQRISEDRILIVEFHKFHYYD